MQFLFLNSKRTLNARAILNQRRGAKLYPADGFFNISSETSTGRRSVDPVRGACPHTCAIEQRRRHLVYKLSARVRICWDQNRSP